MESRSLTRFAWLSIAAAMITIGLKAGAYFLTGSVGLLSDAMESGVNLIAAIVALGALTIAARPPDDEHAYGHDKAEYFSSGVEGALILVAAASIAITSINRLLNPQSLEQVGVGLVISLAASLVNFGVARVLLNASRQYNSITLEADSRHLMTDVWTSVGVVAGIALVGITRWEWLDPVIALLVAVNIVWSGIGLIRRSVLGLMDTALPDADRAKVQAILDSYRHQGVAFHAMRSRQSGPRRFVSVHVLVPDNWTVRQGHDLLERIERDIRNALPQITVFTHMEPLGDPVSQQDMMLDRVDKA
jgi:cation diffusion facilitator family transporter